MKEEVGKVDGWRIAKGGGRGVGEVEEGVMQGID